MNTPDQEPLLPLESVAVRRARLAGRIAQALVLAALISAALFKFLLYGGGAAVVFRYQGF
jgi:hypothetical protein